MKLAQLHSWTLDPAAAVALQKRLAGQVKLCDQGTTPPAAVAGVDVSCRLHSRVFHAAVVVLSFPQLQPLETATVTARVDFPYIPGLLSFRELPVLLEAFARLRQAPDLVLVDGQGIAHPRGIGLASHLGLWLQLPTIGCAKSRLYGTHPEVGMARGERVPLNAQDGQVIGSVLRSRERVKPLYVSPGHLCSIEQATDLVLACCGKYRLPEPIRAAHQACNHQRQLWEAAENDSC